MAWWSGKYYDRYLDREVRFARHAQSIDEARRNFPRVGWGRTADLVWQEQRGHTEWLRKIWFAGNHSDIGGSYPEDESRLSDIALQWMIEQLEAAAPEELQIRRELLVTSPDCCGLQHDERLRVLDLEPRWLRRLSRERLTWREQLRDLDPHALLHPSVVDRFRVIAVPHMDEMRPYRPANLREHEEVRGYFDEGKGANTLQDTGSDVPD